jgi:hypothetical protein
MRRNTRKLVNWWRTESQPMFLCRVLQRLCACADEYFCLMAETILRSDSTYTYTDLPTEWITGFDSRQRQTFLSSPPLPCLGLSGARPASCLMSTRGSVHGFNREAASRWPLTSIWWCPMVSHGVPWWAIRLHSGCLFKNRGVFRLTCAFTIKYTGSTVRLTVSDWAYYWAKWLSHWTDYHSSNLYFSILFAFINNIILQFCYCLCKPKTHFYTLYNGYIDILDTLI